MIDFKVVYNNDMGAKPVDYERWLENTLSNTLKALTTAHIALEYISDYDIPLCTHEIVIEAIEKATGRNIKDIVDENN